MGNIKCSNSTRNTGQIYFELGQINIENEPNKLGNEPTQLETFVQ